MFRDSVLGDLSVRVKGATAVLVVTIMVLLSIADFLAAPLADK
jgi:hypothetical protein